MGAITFFSFEGDGGSNGPRRPSRDDLGGTAKINLPGKPPPPTHPAAEEWNEMVRQIVAMAGITPVMALTLDFDSGDPYIAKFWCINSTVDVGDLSLMDNADGDTTVTYPDGKLPSARVDPNVSMNESTAATTVSAELNETLRTIRIRTIDESAAAGVDTRTTCWVY